MGQSWKRRDNYLEEGEIMKYKCILISGFNEEKTVHIIKKLTSFSEFILYPLYETQKTFRLNKSSDDYNQNDLDDKIKDCKITCEGYSVGFSVKEVQKILEKGKTPILALSPHYLDELSEILDRKGLYPMSFLIRNNQESEEEKVIEKKCFSKISYVINRCDVSLNFELVDKLWEFKNIGGGIHRELIELLIKNDMLLRDAKSDLVSNASYDIRLGDEYFYSGKIEKLSSNDPFIMIEPYDYVIASCHEGANFPRDVSARFDVSVNLFCQGIILSNSTQVDPGFRGKLFCLLFNTSNKSVCLKRGEHFVTIEFQKLLEPTTPYSGRYSEKEEIVHYLPNNVMQGAINELKKEIELLKDESKNMQNLYLSMLGLILAIIAIVIVF